MSSCAQDAQDVSNTHLQDILARLDELRAAPPIDNTDATRHSTGGPTASRARRVAFGDPQHPASATVTGNHDEQGDNYEEYAGDTEADHRVNHNNTRDHRQLRFNRQGMGRAPH